MVGSRNALLQGGVYMCVHYQCIQRPTPICTRILHVHDPSPYHTRTCTFTCTRLHFTCSCPKKTSPLYSDMTPPISLITSPTPPTPSLSICLPLSNITTLLHTSPLPLPPSPLPCHPTPPPSLNVPAVVPYMPDCTSSRSKSSYISSFSAKSGSCKDQWDINTPPCTITGTTCAQAMKSVVHSLFRTIPRFLLPLLPLLPLSLPHPSPPFPSLLFPYLPLPSLSSLLS